MASNSLALGVSTGKDTENPSPSSFSHNSGQSPQRQASDLLQSDTRSNPAPKKQKPGKGKSKQKTKPLEQRKSVPWKSDHTVMNFLTSKLPQYQLLLEEKETQKKRQWLEETEHEVVLHCPQDWVDHWGTDHLKKCCRDWFNNNRREGLDDASKVIDNDNGSAETPAPKPKTVATASKSVLGKMDDNPLARALRARKVSGMRLWGSAHNAQVQKRISETNVSKIGGWSQCVSWIWHNKLTEEERAEWTNRAGEAGESDKQQCFRNQLGISVLLAGLLSGLIGVSPTQIGKSCFSVHIAYHMWFPFL